MLIEIKIYKSNLYFQITGALRMYNMWLQQSAVSEKTSKHIDTVQKSI